MTLTTGIDSFLIRRSLCNAYASDHAVRIRANNYKIHGLCILLLGPLRAKSAARNKSWPNCIWQQSINQQTQSGSVQKLLLIFDRFLYWLERIRPAARATVTPERPTAKKTGSMLDGTRVPAGSTDPQSEERSKMHGNFGRGSCYRTNTPSNAVIR